MFKLIKFNSEVEIITVKDKRFICSKNGNYINQKVGVIPKGEGVVEFLELLQKKFCSLSETKEFFHKSVELKLLLNQLFTGTFFVFKHRSSDDFVFYPKHSKAMKDIHEANFETCDDSESKAFLRRVGRQWEIDAPSSPFYIKTESEVGDASKLSPSFLNCLHLKLLNCNENGLLDFKDELFLYNLRKRTDLPKGTIKNRREIELKSLNHLYGESSEKLNLYKLPSVFRRNSSRSNLELPKEPFLRLLEDVFSIQAILDDPYFGRVKKKNFPSAGSGYGLIPIIYINNVSGMKKGVYSIDEEKHCLVEMEVPDSHFHTSMQSFKNSWGAINGFPSATIQFIFSPAFYYQKYAQTCLALNMLNGGVLISEVYKFAQKNNLGACALGGVYEDLWSDITDGEYFSLCEISLTA
ncbi:MAG: hypothetical protein CME64_03460 [Halobacteriovoraceae bacterium]|nr:hypothetical protein [Halobacteriovoraceae bacterium]